MNACDVGHKKNVGRVILCPNEGSAECALQSALVFVLSIRFVALSANLTNGREQNDGSARSKTLWRHASDVRWRSEGSGAYNDIEAEPGRCLELLPHLVHLVLRGPITDDSSTTLHSRKLPTLVGRDNS